MSGLLSAGINICTELVSHRSRKREMQKKAELEKELIEKRAQSRGRQMRRVDGPQRSEPVDHRPDPTTQMTQFDQDIEAIRQGPDCNTCQQLLSQLVEMPPEKRRRGVSELAELKLEMQRSPDEGDIRALMDRFEVLPEAALEI